LRTAATARYNHYVKMSFHTMEKDDGYAVRAVERAADVLAALAEADTPQTLQAIAERAELSVTTTFRLLRTLQRQGFVMPSVHDGRYVLGFRVLELAHALLRQLDVVGVARPFVMDLRNRIGETVSLAVRSGEYHVRTLQAEGTQPLRRVLAIGERMPLYAGSVGKLFLAAASDDEIEEYLGHTELVPLSEATPTEPRAVWEQIGLVRARGFSESINERGLGGAGLAAPIHGPDGRVVAALEISGPATRFTPEVRETWIAASRATAGEISRALGYREGRGGGRSRLSNEVMETLQPEIGRL
jgi:IclR family transcriptional regulator, KDG regulon repressor